MFSKALEKRRQGESGFTLIELLVVVIIIGILAAIAIPIFISQQNKAKIASVKSDLANAAIAAQAFATDNNGAYTNMTVGGGGANDLVASYDLKQSPNNSLVVRSTANGFCIDGTNSQVTGTWKVDTRAGGSTAVVSGACA